jgi:hypothetical protein
LQAPAADATFRSENSIFIPERKVASPPLRKKLAQVASQIVLQIAVRNIRQLTDIESKPPSPHAIPATMATCNRFGLIAWLVMRPPE